MQSSATREATHEPSGDGYEWWLLEPDASVRDWQCKYVGGDAAPIPMARYVGLKPYSGPADAASTKNLVISERQRALFIEGFRNYDIERFQIPFNPPVGTNFPVGGGTYGNTTCLPLPDIEKNNNPSLGPSFVPSTTGA